MDSEERLAQYYIRNAPELGPLLFALHQIGRKPHAEIRQGTSVLGYVYRFTMPHGVETDLKRAFAAEIDLEQFRYEPDGPITAASAAEPIPAACEAPPENA